MEKIKKDKWFLYFAMPLAVLLVIAAGGGVFIENTYALETPVWKVQGIAQDVIDLFIIVPVLVVSGILSYYNKRVFIYIFGGTVLYLAYSYFLYCFAVHFNYLFLIYCFILGLSVYSFIYFIVKLTSFNVINWYNGTVPVKTISIYLLVISGVFYILWLGEIVPAIIHQKIPENIIQNGLLTNPVHVLDISLILPAFIITAVLLLKKRNAAFVVAPAMLVFCILMNINIAGLVIAMKWKGMADSFMVAWLMGTLTIITIVMLYIFLRHLRYDNAIR